MWLQGKKPSENKILHKYSLFKSSEREFGQYIQLVGVRVHVNRWYVVRLALQQNERPHHVEIYAFMYWTYRDFIQYNNNCYNFLRRCTTAVR